LVAHWVGHQGLIAGWAVHMDSRERLTRLNERSKASIEIRRQKENYEINKLFGPEYCEGMGDASVIVFDGDKQGEVLQSIKKL
jgi:hypothetical protein